MQSVSFSTIVKPYLQGKGSVRRTLDKVDPRFYKVFADHIEKHEKYATPRMKQLHAAAVKKCPPPCTLSNLPLEILCIINKKLPAVQDTLALCQVNRALSTSRAALLHTDEKKLSKLLIKHLENENEEAITRELTKLTPYGSSEKTLDLHIEHHWPRLVFCLNDIQKLFPNISLTIYLTNVLFREELTFIFRALPQLKTVLFVGSSFTYADYFPQSLETVEFIALSTCAATLQAIFRQCTNLKTLSCNSSFSLQADPSFFANAPWPKTLTTLELEQCLMDAADLKNLFSRCPDLVNLAVSSNPSLNNDDMTTVTFPENLEKLDISNTPIADSGFLHSIDSCKKLKILVCRKNERVSASALQNANYPPTLERCILDQSNLTGDSLRTLVSKCPNLKLLSIRNCPNLQAEDIRTLTFTGILFSDHNLKITTHLK